jgi:hypothetical protein
MSPGEVTSPRLTGSVTTTMSNAPAARHASPSLVQSRTWPKKPGFCTTTQEVLCVEPCGQILATFRIRLEQIELEAEEVRMGAVDSAIMRMQATREHGARAGG